jgi:Holliday junction resolvase-like predicted endonuclease
MDGETVVFVEVKSRAGAFDANHPAVARAQRRRIGRAARAFRSRYGVRHLPYRFDLVTLEGPLEDPRVNWHKRLSEV